MKPKFKILEKDGQFAILYLQVTKRFLLPDRKEWKPFIHYLGLPNDIFWHSSLDNLRQHVLYELKII